MKQLADGGYNVTWDLWVNLAVIVLTFIGATIFFIIFIKYRIKYHLVVALGGLLNLVIFILNYIYPKALVDYMKSLGFNHTTIVVLYRLVWVILTASMMFLLYYPQIKRIVMKVIQKRISQR
jgi:hypothetical protein